MPSVESRDDADLRNQVVELIPSLRAFARTLVHDAAASDDLVQETLVKALANLHRFQAGTNIQAWLFTILRNSFYSELRKRRSEVEDVDGQHAERLFVEANQHAKADLRDFRRAMAALPSEQREALILVGPAGFAYEEAAEICGCAIGTIKSRVNRARIRLFALLNGADSSGATPVLSEAAPEACAEDTDREGKRTGIGN